MIGFIVGTSDCLSVDPPRDTMSRGGESQCIHRTIEEASKYKRQIEKAFSVPLVIYKGEFEQVDAVPTECKPKHGHFSLK